MDFHIYTRILPLHMKQLAIRAARGGRRRTTDETEKKKMVGEETTHMYVHI